MHSVRINDVDGSRSTEDAKKSIKINTLRENKVKPVIIADLTERYKQAVSITDNGVDNTGEFIEKDEDITTEPDWLITIGDKTYPTEVLVHSEKHKIVSFKTFKLNNITEQGRILVIRENYYFSIDQKAIATIREKGELLERGQCMKINGGKESIRMQNNDMQLMAIVGIIKRFYYKSKAKEIMNSLIEEVYPQ